MTSDELDRADYIYKHGGDVPTEEKDTQTWLREVEERHVEDEGDCQTCDKWWPCESVKLLALVRKQEAIIKEAKAAMKAGAHRMRLAAGVIPLDKYRDDVHGWVDELEEALASMQEIEKGEKP